MDRLEQVHQAVDDILRGQPDDLERRCGFVHLYGVSMSCALLALKRGLDVQLCTVAGMLHDIATYKSGDPTDHGRRSALEAGRLLAELGGFTPDERTVICAAISRHRAKREIDGEIDELLKDADVLQHYLYNPGIVPPAKESARLRAVLAELGAEGQTGDGGTASSSQAVP